MAQAVKARNVFRGANGNNISRRFRSVIANVFAKAALLAAAPSA